MARARAYRQQASKQASKQASFLFSAESRNALSAARMRPPPVRKEKYAAVAAKKLLLLAVVAQRIRLARSTKRKQIYITQTERVYVSKQRIQAKRRQPFLQKTEMRLACAARMRRCKRGVRGGARAHLSPTSKPASLLFSKRKCA